MTSWAAHRSRAEELRGRYPFAAEVLGCYLALLDVWEEAEAPPSPHRLSAWAAQRVVPGVVKATEAAGPEALAAAVRDVSDVEGALAGWLAGVDLPPVERYLARAALTAPLAALGEEAGAACADARSLAAGDQRHCPRCGGLPQFSVRTDGQDHLVRGRRDLACARCAQRWAYSSTACPSCGEASGGKRTVYSETHAGPIIEDTGEATFPHLRVDACAACERYLIDIDLGRDNRAVPEVDELVALPLDLYAADQGLSKITPNLMGY